MFRLQKLNTSAAKTLIFARILSFLQRYTLLKRPLL
jgi:hypothetical protein